MSEFPIYSEELCHAGLPAYERCPRSHAFVLGAKKLWLFDIGHHRIFYIILSFDPQNKQIQLTHRNINPRLTSKPFFFNFGEIVSSQKMAYDSSRPKDRLFVNEYFTYARVVDSPHVFGGSINHLH